MTYVASVPASAGFGATVFVCTSTSTTGSTVVFTDDELFERSGSPIVVELILAVFVNEPSAIGRCTVMVIDAVSAVFAAPVPADSNSNVGYEHVTVAAV